MTSVRLRFPAILTLFVLISFDSALAFYHPNEGKWLSRDPIGEPGFELVSSRPLSSQEELVHSLRIIFDDIQRKAPEIVQTLKRLLLNAGIDLYSVDTQRNSYLFVGNDPAGRIDPLGLKWWWPPDWFKTGDKEKKEKECCDKEAAKKLIDEAISNLLDEAKELPGKAGQIAKIIDLLKTVKDSGESCAGMSDVAKLCTDFAKDPDYSGCMQCCMGIYSSFPLIGGVGYFACNSICAPFID